MRVLIADERVSAALIEQRRADEVDVYDEIHEGVYWVNPAGTRGHGRVQGEILFLLTGEARRLGLVACGPINVGSPDDFRVPDVALLAAGGRDDDVYVATAVMVVEVRSDRDATYEKFPFYARHGVAEIVVVVPGSRTVELWLLNPDRVLRAERPYVAGSRSAVRPGAMGGVEQLDLVPWLLAGLGWT